MPMRDGFARGRICDGLKKLTHRYLDGGGYCLQCMERRFVPSVAARRGSRTRSTQRWVGPATVHRVRGHCTSCRRDGPLMRVRTFIARQTGAAAVGPVRKVLQVMRAAIAGWDSY